MLTGHTSSIDLMESIQNARIFNHFKIDSTGKKIELQDARRFYEDVINELITEARGKGYDVTTFGCESLTAVNVDDFGEPCSGLDNGCICDACTALIAPLC